LVAQSENISVVSLLYETLDALVHIAVVLRYRLIYYIVDLLEIALRQLYPFTHGLLLDVHFLACLHQIPRSWVVGVTEGLVVGDF